MSSFGLIFFLICAVLLAAIVVLPLLLVYQIVRSMQENGKLAKDQLELQRETNQLLKQLLIRQE